MKDKIVIFTLEGLSYAFSLLAVVRVIHAIEVRPLPGAPEIITGIINVQGLILPVIDLRKRFGLKSREIDIDDRLIIANTGKRQVAIPVDTVKGIRDLTPEQLDQTKETLSFAKNLKGVAKIDDNLILIYDLELFLSPGEDRQMELALKRKSK